MKRNSYNKLSSSDLFIVQNPCPIHKISHLGPILRMNFLVKGQGHIRPFFKKNIPIYFKLYLTILYIELLGSSDFGACIYVKC